MRRMTIALAVGWLAIPVALATTTTGIGAISHAVFHPATVQNGHALVTSSNWSGVADSGGTYTSVKGSWKVPAINSTSGGNRFASDWVGIGGYFGTPGDLIQAGTGEQVTGGVASYNAWTEILPRAEVPIPGFTVHPGDLMTVTIKKGAGKKWTIVVNDATSRKTFTKHLTYASCLCSAEWIHEAPFVGGSQATLASTTNAVFDPGFVNGVTVIGSGGTVNRIQLIGPTDATPSTLDSDNNGFQVADGSGVPPPPST
jgi:Peptidase A4 family